MEGSGIIKFMIDISNYDKIRGDAESYYRALVAVMCPALKDTVSFPSDGFNHLIYKSHRSERDRSSQVMRFKLLARAVYLIGTTTTFQEYDETIREFTVKRYKKKIKETKAVQYWGIIAIVDNRKIKVIVRKIGNGSLHFWSVVPAWITNKTRDGKFISTMKGDPAED